MLEADGNYVRLHTKSETHHLRETLTWFEEQMPPGCFLRISRSTLVSFDRIKELRPLFYGDYTVLLHDGTRLNLSRSFRDRVEKLLERRRKQHSQ